MRKNIFFNYRDPWVPCHGCMGKGEIHYIEVIVDSVDSEEEEHENGSTSLEEDSAQAEEHPPCRPPTSVGAHPPIVP
jgi:hypothetical protein